MKNWMARLLAALALSVSLGTVVTLATPSQAVAGPQHCDGRMWSVDPRPGDGGAVQGATAVIDDTRAEIQCGGTKFVPLPAGVPRGLKLSNVRIDLSKFVVKKGKSTFTQGGQVFSIQKDYSEHKGVLKLFNAKGKRIATLDSAGNCVGA